jgi:hypothetical protein
MSIDKYKSRSFILSNIEQFGKPETVENIIENLDKSGNYNCWGFTATMLNWISELKWLDSDEMEELLDSYSKPIDPEDVQDGDIAVYRRKNSKLDHTALVISAKDELLIHKPGSGEIETQNFDGTLGEAYYGDISEFRRPAN